MNHKTKAAFKWITATAIALGVMIQPVMAGERYHYKKHYYSSSHQHNANYRHGYRQKLNHNGFYHRTKRQYYKKHNHNYKRNSGYGSRIKHHYKRGYRKRYGSHSGYRYKHQGGINIRINF